MLVCFLNTAVFFAKNVAFKVNWSQDHHNLSVGLGKYQTTAAMCSENIPQENKSGSNIYNIFFFFGKSSDSRFATLLKKRTQSQVLLAKIFLYICETHLVCF